MKILAVSALVCALMALTRAAALPEAEAKDQIVKSHLVKRSKSCPAGWTEFNGHCFHYDPRNMNWAKAERSCQSMNANLASVHNIHDYHEIQKLILRVSYEFTPAWIGGSDAQVEGVWLWSDGSHFTYQNWCSGQPDNDFGQHCLLINYGEKKCWDDDRCNSPRPFVCAKKI
ncbi:type-2 ice-structuring protein-like [Scomber scombrus]|uniref:type-2 ice-structuring protein-like n=1 Tax=Scomber scombrus TaxID=13677 RepID=UPI002DDAB998|nr:type-2 ice-structuring protein-like [Scomber scombrus]